MAIPNWLTGVYRRLTTRPARPRRRSRRTNDFTVPAMVETLESRRLLSADPV